MKTPLDQNVDTNGVTSTGGSLTEVLLSPAQISQIEAFNTALDRADADHTEESHAALLAAAQLILQHPLKSALYATDYNCARLLLTICGESS